LRHSNNVHRQRHFFSVISCRALKQRCIVLPKLAYYINEIAQQNGISNGGSSLSPRTLQDVNGNGNQTCEEEQEPAFSLRALVTNATGNLFFYPRNKFENQVLSEFCNRQK